MTKKKVTKKEIREISFFDCSFAISKCCKGRYGENDVTVALDAIGRSFEGQRKLMHVCCKTES